MARNPERLYNRMALAGLVQTHLLATAWFYTVHVIVQEKSISVLKMSK